MDRRQAVTFLMTRPVDFAHMIGFDKLGELHNEWMRSMIVPGSDQTLQSHRGSYKTTCVSVAIPIIMLLYPNDRILFERKTDNDVKEVVSQVAKVIKTPYYAAFAEYLYGRKVELVTEKSTELTIDTVGDIRGTAQLVGMGTGGSLTGKHFDRIFTDDIVNLNDRIYHAERERTKIVYQELQNLKNKGGKIFNTGTPWHKEDAFSLMPEAKKYDCYSTGILSKEQIEEYRQTMAPSLFAANYELKHIASEMALFTEAPQFFDDPSLLRDGKAHVDASYGGEDYTAFTCGKLVGDTLYMYGKMWHDHVDKHLPAIIADAERLQCGPIICEDNGDKGFLAKEIKQFGYRAVTYHEGENKYIKIANYLRKWWTKIRWLEGTDKEYLNQILDYTEDAEHDDAPDSAAVLCRFFNMKSGKAYKSPIFQNDT